MSYSFATSSVVAFRQSRALSARRKRGDEDFGALARAINDLNLAQHDFSEAAAAVVKESG